MNIPPTPPEKCLLRPGACHRNCYITSLYLSGVNRRLWTNKCVIVLFWFSQDVEALAEKLSNVAEKKVMPFPEFNHLDFLWANDVRNIVYDDLIAFMKRYERKYETPQLSADVDANVVHSDYVEIDGA